MKFEVFRTSGPLSAQEDQKPCEEAHFMTGVSTTGVKYKYWAVYINTLDELLELLEEVENPIVINKYENGGLSIEIYDDYRE